MIDLHKNPLIKVVAVILTLIFAHQQVGWTENGRPVWANYSNSQNDINIPYDIGQINDKLINGSKEKIIHIQDAHSSLSAQESITNILERIVCDYDISMVAIEGADDYVDTSLLRTYPDKDVKKDTAKFLMKEGRMSAGEFFSVTCKEENVLLYGVEDKSLYNKNLEEFRKVAGKRSSYIKEVDKILDQLEFLSKKVYSNELSALERYSSLHKHKELSFTEYWKRVKGLAKKQKLSLGDYPDIQKLIESVKLEKEIDFNRANFERKNLIDAVSAKLDKIFLEELVGKVVLFKNNKISQVEFNTYLSELAKDNDIPAEKYENFIRFTEYVSTYNEIDILALYHEIALLEDEIRESLYVNDDQRELHKWIKTLKLVKGLYSAQLGNGDFKELTKIQSPSLARKLDSFIKNTCREYRASVADSFETDYIFGGMTEAMDFYLLAEKRNKAMLDNTIKYMRKEGKEIAALITGGYHTQGLVDLMKKNKISYMVVAPKFKEGKERPYMAILTNKKKSYEKALDPSKYKIVVEAYFENGKLEILDELMLLNLTKAAANGQNWQAEARKWAEKYGEFYTKREVDDPSKVKDLIDPKEFVNRFVDVAIVEHEGAVYFRRINDGFNNAHKRTRNEDGSLQSPLELSSSEAEKVWKEISFKAIKKVAKYFREKLNIMEKTFKEVSVGELTDEKKKALERLRVEIKEILENIRKEEGGLFSSGTSELASTLQTGAPIHIFDIPNTLAGSDGIIQLALIAAEIGQNDYENIAKGIEKFRNIVKSLELVRFEDVLFVEYKRDKKSDVERFVNLRNWSWEAMPPANFDEWQAYFTLTGKGDPRKTVVLEDTFNEYIRSVIIFNRLVMDGRLVPVSNDDPARLEEVQNFLSIISDKEMGEVGLYAANSLRWAGITKEEEKQWEDERPEDEEEGTTLTSIAPWTLLLPVLGVMNIHSALIATLVIGFIGVLYQGLKMMKAIDEGKRVRQEKRTIIALTMPVAVLGLSIIALTGFMKVLPSITPIPAALYFVIPAFIGAIVYWTVKANIKIEAVRKVHPEFTFWQGFTYKVKNSDTQILKTMLDKAAQGASKEAKDILFKKGFVTKESIFDAANLLKYVSKKKPLNPIVVSFLPAAFALIFACHMSVFTLVILGVGTIGVSIATLYLLEQDQKGPKVAVANAKKKAPGKRNAEEVIASFPDKVDIDLTGKPSRYPVTKSDEDMEIDRALGHLPDDVEIDLSKKPPKDPQGGSTTLMSVAPLPLLLVSSHLWGAVISIVFVSTITVGVIVYYINQYVRNYRKNELKKILDKAAKKQDEYKTDKGSFLRSIILAVSALIFGADSAMAQGNRLFDDSPTWVKSLVLLGVIVILCVVPIVLLVLADKKVKKRLNEEAAKKEKIIKERVISAASVAARHIEQDGWVISENSEKIVELLNKLKKSSLEFTEEKSERYVVKVDGRIGDTVKINTSHIGKYSDLELESIIVGEMVRQLPEQFINRRHEKELQEKLDKLSSSMRGVGTRDKEGDQLREIFKSIIAIRIQNEFQVLNVQNEYRMNIASSEGFGSLKNYYLHLSEESNDPNLKKEYELLAEHTLPNSGILLAQIKMLLIIRQFSPFFKNIKDMARIENVNPSNRDAMTEWALSWLTEEKYTSAEILPNIKDFSIKPFGFGPATIIDFKKDLFPGMNLWKYAIEAAPVIEESIFFLAPMLLFATLASHLALPIFSAVVIPMAVIRAGFFALHNRGVDKKTSSYIIPLIVASLGVPLSVMPFLLVGVIPVAIAVLYSALVMTLLHFWMNLLAMKMKASPAAIRGQPKEEDVHYHYEYDLKQLDSRFWQERGVDIREIKNIRWLKIPSAYFQKHVKSDLNLDEKLSKYLYLIIHQISLQLHKQEYGFDIEIDPKNVYKYLSAIIHKMKDDDKLKALAWFDAMAKDPQGAFFFELGVIGAISKLDIRKRQFSIDVGVLKYLGNSRSIEVLLATTFARQFLGYMVEADLSDLQRNVQDVRTSEILLKSVDSMDIEDSQVGKMFPKEVLSRIISKLGDEGSSLSVKFEDAEHTEDILKQTQTSSEAIIKDIDTVLRRIGYPEELPYTAYYMMTTSTKKRFCLPELINGRYRPLATLGQGGMGCVVIAYDRLDDNLVTIKINMLEDESYIKRFNREIKTTREVSLEQESVVEVSDMGTYQGINELGENKTFYFYTMEYLPWASAENLILGDKLSIDDSVDITINAARALGSLHAKKLIHRDIKPANLMVNGKQVKVIDLGLVKRLGDDEDEVSQQSILTGEDIAMGTPGYMSPEQCEDAAKVDEKTDVFALGATLYEMVTGQKPFTGTSARNILVNTITKEPVPPREYNKEAIDEFLEYIILKALAKDVRNRYQSTNDMIKDLRDWKRGRRIVPTQPLRRDEDKRRASSKKRKDAHTPKRPAAGSVRGSSKARHYAQSSEKESRAHARRAPKKSNTGMLAALGATIVALLVIIIAVLMSGKETETVTSKPNVPEVPVVVTEPKEDTTPKTTETPKTTLEHTETTTTETTQTETTTKVHTGPVMVDPIPNPNEALVLDERGDNLKVRASRSIDNLFNDEDGGSIQIRLKVTDDFPEEHPTWKGIISKTGWSISCTADGNLTFVQRDQAGNQKKWAINRCIAFGREQNIAITVQQDSIKVFVDGAEKQARISYNTFPRGAKTRTDSGVPLYIGSGEIISGIEISELVLADRAWAPNEAKTMSSKRRGRVRSSDSRVLRIVAAYDFQEGRGVTIRDYSGNGNDGTIDGGEWYSSKRSKPKSDDSALIKGGRGLKFDGEKGYIKIPASPSLANIWKNGGTIETVLKINPNFVKRNDGRQVLAEKRGKWSLLLFRPNQNKANLTFIVKAGGHWGVDISKYIEGSELHVMMTLRESSGKIRPVFYVKGERLIPYKVESFNGVVDDDSRIPLDVAGSSTRTHKDLSLDGELYYFAIFNKMKDLAYARKRHDIGESIRINPDDSDLVLGFDFDEREGNVVIDKSDNGNDGTLEPRGREPERITEDPGTIGFIKRIISPFSNYKEYAIKLAPFIEEGLFFALPMLVSSVTFGLESIWSLVIMAITRGVFFFMHEGARPNTPQEKWRTPLKIAGFGLFSSVIAISLAAASVNPLTAILVATSLLVIPYHIISNIKALQAGEAPGTIKKQEELSETDKLIEELSSSTGEERIKIVNKLGDVATSNSQAISELVKILGDKNINEDLKIAIVRALAKLKKVSIPVREEGEISSSIMGIINGALDELEINRNSVKIIGPYNEIKILFDPKTSPVEKKTRLLNLLGEKFGKAKIRANIEPKEDRLVIKFMLNVANLTAFWRGLGSLDFREEDGAYVKLTTSQIVSNIIKRAELLLDGIEEDIKNIKEQGATYEEYKDLEEEYRQLHFFVYGDGTNTNPGLINIVRHPERLRRISEEEYGERYRTPVEQSKVLNIDGKKYVTYGDSQIIRVESVEREEGENFCSFNEILEMTRSNPILSHYIENFHNEKYPSKAPKRRIYMARAAGSAFQDAYIGNIMAGEESIDQMFFISQDTIYPYSDTIGKEVDRRVTSHGDTWGEPDITFTEIENGILGYLDKRYEEKADWKNLLDTIWTNFEVSGIRQKTDVLAKVEPGDHIMVIDEIANGSYDFMLKYIVERKSLEENLRKKGVSLEDEVNRIMRERDLSEDEAYRLAREENQINVDIFVGQPRTAGNIADYPTLELDKVMKDFGRTRSQADSVIKAVSTIADFMPHPVRVKEGTELPIVDNKEIPIELEKSDILVSSYLKALYTINGRIEYHNTIALYPIVKIIRNEMQQKSSKRVRLEAVKALSEFYFDDLAERAKKVLEEVNVFEEDEEIRLQAAESIIKIITKQTDEVIRIDEEGNVKIADPKKALKNIGLITRASQSPYPRVRNFAAEVLSVLYKGAETKVKTQLASIPENPRNILKTAQDEQFIVPSVSMGLGKLSLRLQARALLEAAKKKDSVISFEISENAFNNFDYENELSAVDKTAELAEEVFAGERAVYYYSMGDIKVTDYSDSSQTERIKTAIIRAFKRGISSYSIDCTEIYVPALLVTNYADGSEKVIGNVTSEKEVEKDGKTVTEYKVIIRDPLRGIWKKETIYFDKDEVFGSIPEEIKKSLFFGSQKLLIKKDLTAQERFERVAIAASDIYSYIVSESLRFGLPATVDIYLGDSEENPILKDKETYESFRSLLQKEITTKVRIQNNRGLKSYYGQELEEKLSSTVSFRIIPGKKSQEKAFIAEEDTISIKGVNSFESDDLEAISDHKPTIVTSDKVWQMIIWRTLEAYCPEIYREIFDRAREAARKEGADYVTDDVEVDFKTSSRKIILNYINCTIGECEEDKDYSLINKIRTALHNSEKRMKSDIENAERQDLDFIMNGLQFTEDKNGLTAEEMIHQVTLSVANKMFDELGSTGSRKKVKKTDDTKLLISQIADLLHSEKVFSLLGPSEFKKGYEQVANALIKKYYENLEKQKNTIAAIIGPQMSGKRPFINGITKEINEHAKEANKQIKIHHISMEDGWMIGYSRRHEVSVLGRYDLMGALGFRSFLYNVRNRREAFVPFFAQGRKARFRLISKDEAKGEEDEDINEEKATALLKEKIEKLKNAGAKPVRHQEATLLKIFDDDGKWLVDEGEWRDELNERFNEVARYTDWNRAVNIRNFYIDITPRKNGGFITGDIVEKITPRPEDIYLVTGRLLGSDEVLLSTESREIFNKITGTWSSPEIRRLRIIKEMRTNEIYSSIPESVILSMFDKDLIIEELAWVDPTLQNANPVVMYLSEFERFLVRNSGFGLPEHFLSEVYVLLEDYFTKTGNLEAVEEELAGILSSYNNEEKASKAEIIERIRVDILKEKKEEAAGEKAVSEAQFVIGVPSAMNLTKENINALSGIENAEVVIVEGPSEEAMLEELETARENKEALGSVLVDTNTEIENLKDMVAGVIDKLEEKINELTSPVDKAGKDRSIQEVLNLSEMTKEELYNALLEEVEGLDAVRSMNISAKSIYELKITRTGLAKIEEVSGISDEAISGLLTEGETKYISITAKDAADMKFIADAIEKLGLQEKAKNFVQVRITDTNITEDNLEYFLKETGLGKYLGSENVVSSQGEETLEDVLKTVAKSFNAKTKDIVIGDFRDLGRSVGDQMPTFVKMDSEGIASQLMIAAIKIAISTGKDIKPEEILDKTVGKLSFENGIYILIPNMTEIEIENLRILIDNYNNALQSA